MSDILMKGTEPIGQVSDLTADNVEYSSGVSVKQKIDNILTEIPLSSNTDFTYSEQYKFWQSNQSLSAILNGKTLVGIVVYSVLANAVINCVKDVFGKLSVSGIDVSTMTPTTSSQGFVVSLFVK